MKPSKSLMEEWDHKLQASGFHDIEDQFKQQKNNHLQDVKAEELTDFYRVLELALDLRGIIPKEFKSAIKLYLTGITVSEVIRKLNIPKTLAQELRRFLYSKIQRRILTECVRLSLRLRSLEGDR